MCHHNADGHEPKKVVKAALRELSLLHLTLYFERKWSNIVNYLEQLRLGSFSRLVIFVQLIVLI